MTEALQERAGAPPGQDVSKSFAKHTKNTRCRGHAERLMKKSLRNRVASSVRETAFGPVSMERKVATPSTTAHEPDSTLEEFYDCVT
jgi:hypothetical protein